MANTAIIAKVNDIRKHPNADRLQIASVANGRQVVVGMDTNLGDRGVFFDTDLRLSKEYMEANDLLGVWQDGVHVSGGFFHESGQVKAQKMRGVRSDGFWMPISSLEFTKDASIVLMPEGAEFNELGGVEIATKYFTPATMKAMRAARQASSKVIVKMFPEHGDTDKLRDRIWEIPSGAFVVVTEKEHGDLYRVGHVMLDVKLPRWKQWLNDFTHKHFDWIAFEETRWDYVHGTRRVVIDTGKDQVSYYGTHAFRFKATEGITLRKGEILYGEIVGYVDGERTIMESQEHPKELKKELKDYPNPMVYDYGLPVGEQKFVVYRISMMNEDNQEVELSWNQVKQRCHQLGLQHVTEVETFIFDGDHEALMADIDRRVNGENGMSVTKSLHGNHISEGVVVRVESPSGIMRLKHKNYIFLVLEGVKKLQETFVDMEEVS